MPHFISKNPFLKTHIGHNDFYITDYLVNARDNNHAILPVILESLESKTPIFIHCIFKNNTFIYKIDKLTRVSLEKLKEILSFLASELDIISHNLNRSKNHRNIESAFLLNQYKLQNLKPDFIEIGFGSGRHILHLAKTRQDKVILGFEIHPPSIRQVLKAIKLHKLENLYVCNMDARVAMQILESSIASAIFLHFPVPWNDSKHRRVMSEGFLESILRILKSGGMFHLRSDDFVYVQDSIALFLSLRHVRFETSKNNFEDNIISKYEQRWSNLKRDIYDVKLYNLMSFKDLESKDLDTGVESSCASTHIAHLDSKDLRIAESKIKDSNNSIFSLLHILAPSAKAKTHTLISLKVIANTKHIDKENSIFMHFGDFYAGEEMATMSLTFGEFCKDFCAPFSTYLIIENNKIRYLKSPLSIKSHVLAHRFLCKILSWLSSKGLKDLDIRFKTQRNTEDSEKLESLGCASLDSVLLDSIGHTSCTHPLGLESSCATRFAPHPKKQET